MSEKERIERPITGEPAVLRIHGGRLLRRDGLCELSIHTARIKQKLLLPEADLSLPVASGSARAVSITEALPHLDTGAVHRLLLECQRVLAEGGKLFLELPDFEEALTAWARGDEGFFENAAFSQEDIAIWGPREMPATLEARVASLFCAHPRGREQPSWGPPAMAREALRALLSCRSPRIISMVLGNLTADAEERYRLDRQSAWSRSELRDMLRSVGFEVVTFEPEAVEAASTELLGASLSGQRQMLCLAELAPGLHAGPGASRFREAIRLSKLGRLPEALSSLKDAVAREPALAEAHYRLLWDVYTRAIQGRTPRGGAESPTFAKEGYHVGHLPAADVEALRRALMEASVVKVTPSDYAPGYMYNASLSEEAAEAINRENQYLALSPDVLTRVRPLLSALSEPVRACLGTPFRVVNLRSWRTSARAARIESNGWHRDEPYPPMVLKVMIYLCEVGPETGTTEIMRADGSRFQMSGPEGTFLVFKNFELCHRGAPGSRGERLILELTVAPHMEDDHRPVCAGQNADFPLLPWMPLELA